MNPLTCHLILKENEATIERALESLLPLGCHILACDLGCHDDSPKICRKYRAEIVRLSLADDYSKLRNEIVALSDSEWQLYLEPWEVLATGHQAILDALPRAKIAYRLACIQGDMLTKEIRLWNKRTNLAFQNPIYETLAGNAEDLSAAILVESVDHTQQALEIIKKWKERFPLAVEPYYYHSCVMLIQRQWDNFLKMADYYLFHEKSASARMPMTMTRYYCALVQAHVKKDYREAIRNVISCLAVKPLMAEFWCLLADIYYAQKEYEKARLFYKNALILGGRRLRTDDWPLEIPKYKAHPEKMLEGCDRIIGNSRLIVASK